MKMEKAMNRIALTFSTMLERDHEVAAQELSARAQRPSGQWVLPERRPWLRCLLRPRVRIIGG
jgi:hypothetical protein